MTLFLGFLIGVGCILIAWDLWKSKSPSKIQSKNEGDKPVNVTVNIDNDDQVRPEVTREQYEEKDPNAGKEPDPPGMEDEPIASEVPAITREDIVNTPILNEKIEPPVSDIPIPDMAPPNPKDERIDELCQRLIDLYFAAYDPGDEADIKKEMHNIILRIRSVLRYLKQQRIVDGVEKDTPQRAAKKDSKPRPVI
jgi:hypothetical protein